MIYRHFTTFHLTYRQIENIFLKILFNLLNFRKFNKRTTYEKFNQSD